jgi:predicted ester cyclase
MWREATMSQINKAIVRRFVEAYQVGNDLSVGQELLAEDFVNHTATPPFPPDRDGVFAAFAWLRSVIQDLRVVIHDQIAEGDCVVTRKTLHGVHRGELLGIPPTGREVAIDIIDIMRIDAGRLREHWSIVDWLGVLRQLAPGSVVTP